ncbi:hypothetical protein TWF481_010637 [Arthrobotrys musiformis]|uniref:Uncharacterized protein n=1 Tax=Arthrobotrys musiformis TaxID=47236 RepID=A0AAV9W3D5_9PEZI
MFPLAIILEYISLSYLLTLFPHASAWQQSITSDGSSEIRIKVLDYGGDECHNRNGGPEGVMGIMNTRNSDQLKVMAFWDIASCDRIDPERYSLFIHWYDLPSGIQLLNLGLPGLEHRWKSFKRIVPDSATWINYKNPGKGKYIPGPDGMTPIGGFFAGLIQKIPPGSIRYRIMGTNEYITVKDAVYVPKTVSTGESLIEDKMLNVVEMAEARTTLKGQVSNWFYATGGVPGHILVTKDYIFQERVSSAYVQAALPGNIGRIRNPGVLVVKQMLGEYRYPHGDDKSKPLVDAANDERQRIERLQHEAQALKYIQYLQGDQAKNYQKYLETKGGTAGPQLQSEAIVYPPPRFFNQPMGTNASQVQPDDTLNTNLFMNNVNPSPQANLQQQQQQNPQPQTQNIGQLTTGEAFTADLVNTLKEEAARRSQAASNFFIPQSEFGQGFGPPTSQNPSPFARNPQSQSFADMRNQAQDLRRQLTAPKVLHTYNDIDSDFIDILDPNYLQQREALKSKSLNELDWEFGNVDPWAQFKIPNQVSQSFDLGLTNQNQGVGTGPEHPPSSLGDIEWGEEVFDPNFPAGNQPELQEDDQARFEEEKMREIDEYDW